MAVYDQPGVLYDDPTLFYDAPTLNPPKKTMAKVKLGLTEEPVPDIIDECRAIVTAMTGNANFPTPNPALAGLTTQINTLESKQQAAEAARQAALMKTSERDAARAALLANMSLLAAYVESASGGVAEKIQSAGMAVRAEGTPSAMTQVTGLESSPGDDAGEVDLVWDPVKGRLTYEIQSSPDPITPTSWVHRASVSKSTAVLTGLPSATRCWFRVRAIGPNGPGPWSDPATKVVP